MKNLKSVRTQSSGQLLIVAALAIAILISSTTIYVYELSKEKTATQDQLITEFVFAIKQASKNAVINALANASKSGEKSVLEANLNMLSQAFRSLNQPGICNLSFTLLNDLNYTDGVWLSWSNANGFGVSSAYTDFTLTVYGLRTNFTANYAVNMTTAIALNGYYIGEGPEKLVSLSCHVFNEGKPAQAKNITLYYENLGVWVPVNSSNNLSITDYGNGTYTISFTVIVSDPLLVSAHVIDLREIFVQASMTCHQIN
ncbi:MAG: hypothetical protein ACUVTB_03210 [Candidatus Bathycorpusculaceae bacterium]